jgi:uncharacterized BrkB/YihY/UPF0761 family membrane protein
VDQLFAHSGGGSIGLLSGFLLVFSGISLTRRMQRMYQQAWGLGAPPGVGHALHAALGLTALLAGASVLYVLRALAASLPWSGAPVLAVSVATGFVLYTTLPWLLLDRRVRWRRLVPTGLLTAVLVTGYGMASTVYMPRLMETYSQRYGLFGVTLALVGWLLAIAVVLVASAVVAAEFDRAQEPWASHLRRRLGIEPSALGDRPPGVVVEVPSTGDGRAGGVAAPGRMPTGGSG